VPDGWTDVSERVYVTPANREAEERIAQELAPGDAETARIVQAIVERMRAAGDGTWMQQQYAQGWQYRRPERIESARPQRVAVLMDSGCGSSCEQFLLTVRQSFAVKLVGRSRSAGWADASNLRPHVLPSGRRRLLYATTLSNRLPGLPIDGIGVEPDVLLAYPQDEADRSDDVGRTQHWLERGTWESPQEGARSKRESR
jgi:C-terminal processing protease CtpA/Prc